MVLFYSDWLIELRKRVKTNQERLTLKDGLRNTAETI